MYLQFWRVFLMNIVVSHLIHSFEDVIPLSSFYLFVSFYLFASLMCFVLTLLKVQSKAWNCGLMYFISCRKCSTIIAKYICYASLCWSIHFHILDICVFPCVSFIIFAIFCFILLPYDSLCIIFCEPCFILLTDS